MSIQNSVRKLFDIDYGTLEEADRAYVYNSMNELMTARFSRLESQTIVALSNAEEAKDLYTKGPLSVWRNIPGSLPAGWALTF